MSDVIVVTSGKGGVGKTTSSANLGVGLALRGKSVVLMDTDIGLRNLDVVLGLENKIVYDLVDVIEGTCRLRQALIRDTRFEGLYLLPAAQTKSKMRVRPEQMKKLVDEIKREFDYVLIDCPAGIDRGFANAVAGAKSAIVVTVPEVSSVRDADRIIGMLGAQGIEEIRLLINRINPDLVKRGDMFGIEDTVEILGVEPIGIIPEDMRIFRSSNLGEPAVTDGKSSAGAEYMRVVDRLLGRRIPLHTLNDLSGFGTKLKRLFGGR